MRLVSPLALGLMLALAGTTAVTTPAMAAKEKKAPAPQLSKEFSAPASAAQDAIKAGTFDVAKAKLAEAEPFAKTPDELFNLNVIRLNLGISLKDEAIQRTGVEGMLASGAAPAAEIPKYEFFAGDFAMKAKDYDVAIAHFKKSADLGYPGSGPWVMTAEANFQKALTTAQNGQLTAPGKPFAQAGLPYLKKAIEIEKASGAQVPAGWYSRGFSMAYTSGSPDAPEWAAMNLKADPSPKNWRTLLLSYQERTKTLTRGENLDIMRLKLQTGALESEYDFAEYVEAASKSGLLGEEKAVIDKGRASGKLAPTKLADYYSQATAGIPADQKSLASGEAQADKAPTGKLAAGTADAYLSYGQYAKAIALYKTALSKGGVDVPEVNSRLGIALALSGDAAGAKAAFDLVTTGARKDIAQFWMLWLSTKTAA
jgi:tetratricopeptide (TPR) repeat protein